MKYYILLFLTAFMGVVSAQQKNDTVKVRVDSDKVALPFAHIDKDKVVGAIDVIDGKDLLHSSDYNVESILAGQAPGLIAFEGSGSPGLDNTWMKIRGLSRGGQDDHPLIVIDGIANRALSSIAIDEVESIQILKDATAKMLFGSKAANGVIMLTTKRGYNGKSKVSFYHEYGVKTPSRLPEYLNSAQYASLYNQARINDGLDPIYSAEDINNYANNPSVLYPNVNFYDELLKKSTSFQRFNAQLIGGDDRTKYFLNLGYIHEDGLENQGKNQKFDRFNIRGNLDYDVNKTVSMFLDLAGRMDVWDRADITNGAFFGALSSHRPNDYPLYAGAEGDKDNLGYSPRVDTNLLGELARSGYVNNKNYYAQTNLGIDFNLNSLVKGLSASGYVTFDVFNNIAIGKSLTYSRIRFDDPNDLSVTTRIGTDRLDGDEDRKGDNSTQNLGIVAKIDFERSWGDNDLLINLVGVNQTLTRKSTLDGPTTQQDDKSANIGARVNYTFKDKYTIEGSSSYMGSDKFTKENRWGLYGAGGFAWLISNEDFLKDSKSINYLKLKGSYGIMGYDRQGSGAFDYLLFRDFYQGSGSFRTGPQNSAAEFGWRAGQIGNPSLTFEESKELNLGIEARLFNNKIDLEVNYFNELRTGIPVVLRNALPDYTGELKPIGNFNEVSNKGVDLSIGYTDNIGNLNFSLRGNLIYSKSVNEVFDEINQYAHLNRTGQVTDAIWGWQADGLYQNDSDIASHGVTSSYGDIIPGDIKLVDITNDRGDNVIDQFDRKNIGNWFPRVNYSLNLNLEYKGLELYVLGQGTSGSDKLLNNSYYWNTGENKYSVQALGSATPGAVAGATSPRLTSLSESHSYRDSSYWLTSGDFFKIRTAELAYNFSERISNKFGATNFRLFVRGNDLLTISKIKDLDPESLNSGINNYPGFRTLSLGLKLTY
ncbi:SusC/RagA family TonB-linked outer membrane protein [Seonamhaeicola marinus]|uniref:SusC/RagA family TonB-linked outer membrane protein n=1 Tax=Seonamhaeicola marinus TaxID=1912246 RepID=A0A5D0IRS4_9FLAO|nr:SusC/RagA family TonB-linked outer membrane protein [Seonamhaeicola marinus]TYA84342.1 SusC/RagA family TonB-linked outer membrane protein [Seonamhaeicola marinus]